MTLIITRHYSKKKLDIQLRWDGVGRVSHFAITCSEFPKFTTVGREFGRSTSDNIVRSRELASYARPLGPSIGGGAKSHPRAQFVTCGC